MDPEDIQALMGVSENIAALNHARFMNWDPTFTLSNAKQSVLAFKGDVYTGLEANTLSAEELAFAQKHLRILSGLYGLLRPLDLMQPYRLEMGLPFENAGGKNLYEFWGDQITKTLGKHLKASGSPVLVNLASNEYFKAVKPKLLDADVITPQFRDLKNGQYKMISFFANDSIKSAVISVLKLKNSFGLLKIGSNESTKYLGDSDTTFIEYIRDMIISVLESKEA